MLLVEVKNVLITDMGFVIFLRKCSDKQDGRLLPIFIGSVEAQAISLALSQEKSPRPLTHELMRDIMMKLDKKIKMVVIDEYKDNIFYAKIHLGSDNLLRKKNIEIDARPSDAIALALQFKADIYVKQKIFNAYALKVEMEVSIPNDEFYKTFHHEMKDFNKESNLVEDTNQKIGFYQKQLNEAIKEERFEEAAEIRDRIERLISKLS